MDDLIMNASRTVIQAVQEQKEYRRAQMGREFASGHEVWAKIKQLLEEAKADEKMVDKLQTDLWAAIKQKNDDEIDVTLHALGNKATEVCMIFATIAAEAHRSAEEMRSKL